jgi:hypothetical protein
MLMVLLRINQSPFLLALLQSRGFIQNELMNE